MQFNRLPLLSTFKSSQTNKTFKIYHRVNCKISFVIYLLEYYICNIQSVGRSETWFNIRLNNRKDVKSPNAIPACKHFNRHDHDFKSQKNNYQKTTKKHSHDINWDMKRKTKRVRKLLDNETWYFSAICSERRPKLNSFHADLLFTSIILCFYIWSKRTDVSRNITSNILQHL